jgi:hypothetical protein
MDGGGRFPIHHLLYFTRINGYAFAGNSVPTSSGWNPPFWNTLPHPSCDLSSASGHLVRSYCPVVDKPQKFYTIQPEFTLGKFSIELMVTEMLENNAQVLACSSSFLEYIRMSSMKTTINLSSSGMNTEFMRYMK